MKTRYVKVTLEAIKLLKNLMIFLKRLRYMIIYSKVNYFTNIMIIFLCIYPKDINKLITQNKIDVFIYLWWIILPEEGSLVKCMLVIFILIYESLQKKYYIYLTI